MQVTIILDSGGFLLYESRDKPYLDVGYFQSPGASDIEVLEDGKQVQPPPDVKLGADNDTIDVEHLEFDGTTVKTGVIRSTSFDRDILLKTDLYDKAQIPPFIVSAYDCLLRFHSGTFESFDVTDRRFTEHRVGDDGHTGVIKTTRPIANDVLVQYDLAKGELLRLRRPDGKEVWSSASAGTGTSLVEVKLLAGSATNSSYHKTALSHVGPNYYLPNSDPPPMDSQGGGGGG